MDIGYVRVSTLEQNTDRQDIALKFCGRIYKEKMSGKDKNRPQLTRMLEDVRKGDIVWVTELSRLGRSNIDLCEIARVLKDKGVGLRSLKESIDLTSATGIFTFQIFSAMAEFERSLLKERQAEGIAAAQKRIALGEREGWGRKAEIQIPDELFLAYERGEITQAKAARQVGLKYPGGFGKRYAVWKAANERKAALLAQERERRNKEAAEEIRKQEIREARAAVALSVAESEQAETEKPAEVFDPFDQYTEESVEYDVVSHEPGKGEE